MEGYFFAFLKKVFSFCEFPLDKRGALWYDCKAVLENTTGGCSSMVEFQPSKLAAWVRFPSPAPLYAPLAQLDRATAF